MSNCEVENVSFNVDEQETKNVSINELTLDTETFISNYQQHTKEKLIERFNLIKKAIPDPKKVNMNQTYKLDCNYNYSMLDWDLLEYYVKRSINNVEEFTNSGKIQFGPTWEEEKENTKKLLEKMKMNIQKNKQKIETMNNDIKKGIEEVKMKTFQLEFIDKLKHPIQRNIERSELIVKEIEETIF